MKKLIFTLAILAMALSNNLLTATALADANPTYYAKIQTDHAYFYHNPVNDESEKLFKLPTSYFVLIDGYAGTDFYSCRYNDLTGYVKQSDVTPIIGTPSSPYVNFASFRVYALEGIDMRSTPKKSPLNTITHINYLEDRLVYYGPIEGDEYIPDRTTTWYYCKFITNESSQLGYIYSDFCDKLTNIPLNMEDFPLAEGDLFPSITPSIPAPSTELSGTAKTLIIVGVSLPCVVILYLLIKPTLISEKTNKKGAKTKRPKTRRGDYFEFDESDLT